MTCPLCKAWSPDNAIRCDCGHSFASSEVPSAATSTTSSGRKLTARVLLALVWFWIIFKVWQLVADFSSDALDISNPSLLGLVGFGSLIAYFFVTPKVNKSLLIGVAFSFGLMAFLIYSQVRLQHARVQDRVEVCVEFKGRSGCRTASGDTQDHALLSAQTNACAMIASGVTEIVLCGQSNPRSVRWLEKQ